MLDDRTSTTHTGAELTVDACNLTNWDQRREKRNNVSGTNVRLMLTCYAENTIRGQLRIVAAEEIYNLALLNDMDTVCGESFRISAIPVT